MTKLLLFVLLVTTISCNNHNEEESSEGFAFEFMYSISAQNTDDGPKSFRHYIYIRNYQDTIKDFKDLICIYQDTASYDKPIYGITFFDSKKGLNSFKKRYGNQEDIDAAQIREDIVISVALKREINGKIEKCPPIKSYYPKDFKGYGF
jgi:hypothetical protein